ncbi:MAG: hypothetical protein JOZ28_10920 [Candidatus Eremiobacteraeota bacterium]|nr:hypothetical protein [Candidatus Eremiobacteraeota bacterium]
MNAQQLPIFLMHVPKCAGFSVVAFLGQAIAPREICPNTIDGKWRWEPEQVPDYKLYAGHFSVDFVRAMGGRGTMLTMLRHPLARAVSLYDYWRSYRWDFINANFPPYPNNGPAVAKRFALLEFLDQPFAIDNVYNHCARMLLGSRFDELMPDEDATIAEAALALREFDWIGFVEHFDMSIARLGALLDLPVPSSLPRENDTAALGRANPAFEPVVPTKPSQAEKDKILGLNRIDLAVYDAAQKLVRQGSPA